MFVVLFDCVLFLLEGVGLLLGHAHMWWIVHELYVLEGNMEHRTAGHEALFRERERERRTL